MILQSYDFLKLNEYFSCELQAGGSDQWGNITAGIDLIRRFANKKVYGITFPLVTKSDGTKFGKTEAGTIWLDPAKTSPYEFYQFWINSDDRDVLRFLKYFTFLSREQILALQKEVDDNPGKREAQRALAREVTRLVHGQEALQRAERISHALFYGNLRELAGEEIEECFKDVPSMTVRENAINLVDLLVTSGLAPSKRQAREDIRNKAIYINDQPSTDTGKVLTASDRFWDGKYSVIRRGKKNYYLVKWLD